MINDKKLDHDSPPSDELIALIRADYGDEYVTEILAEIRHKEGISS